MMRLRAAAEHGVLVLGARTGWTRREIEALPLSRFTRILMEFARNG